MRQSVRFDTGINQFTTPYFNSNSLQKFHADDVSSTDCSRPRTSLQAYLSVAITDAANAPQCSAARKALLTPAAEVAVPACRQRYGGSNGWFHATSS